MNQDAWTLVDQIAEREAEALRRARKHRSVFYIYHHSKGVISAEQAIFDEGLTLQFTTCAFCGATFDPGPAEPDDPHPHKHGEHTSLFTQDADICNECMFLKRQIMRSAPLVAVRSSARVPVPF